MSRYWYRRIIVSVSIMAKEMACRQSQVAEGRAILEKAYFSLPWMAGRLHDVDNDQYNVVPFCTLILEASRKMKKMTCMLNLLLSCPSRCGVVYPFREHDYRRLERLQRQMASRALDHNAGYVDMGPVQL